MIKNFRKLLNLLKTEKILKYELEKYNKHIREFPNLARLAFDSIGVKVSLFGRFENDELKVLERNVFNKINCSNSTCLDIGANIGNHSVFFANFFNSVNCFEPHPDNYYLLKYNTRKLKNIRIFNFGASDIDEYQYIHTPNDVDLGHSTIETASSLKNLDPNYPEIKVELKNLDNFFKENKEKIIKFIKIDIEGYEYKALVGLKNILYNDSPIVALEQWTDQFYEMPESGHKDGGFNENIRTTPSIDFLKKNNYNFFYEPLFFKRKKGNNKIIRALNKIIFFLQIIFKSNKINLCKLKKIEKFELRPYPMIIASKTDL